METKKNGKMEKRTKRYKRKYEKISKVKLEKGGRREKF